MSQYSMLSKIGRSHYQTDWRSLDSAMEAVKAEGSVIWAVVVRSSDAEVVAKFRHEKWTQYDSPTPPPKPDMSELQVVTIAEDAGLEELVKAINHTWSRILDKWRKR